MLDSRQMNRALTLRYGLALGLIAVLSTFAFLLMEFQLTSKETHASLINVSGRQRTLGLAISLDAGEAYFGRTQAERVRGRTRMGENLIMMEQSHRALVSGEGDFPTPDVMGNGIMDAYFAELTGLDTQVTEFIELGHAYLSGEMTREEAREAVNTLSEVATGPLLDNLNDMVSRYEAYVNSALSRVATLHRAVFVVMAVLLVFEVLFIFRPLASRLSRQTEELSRMARKLADTATDLAAMKDEMEGLVAAIAQDLRVPSNAIRGLADWLTDDLAGKIDDVQHGLLVRLRERSHRFENLLADLQNLCRDVGGEERTGLLDVEAIGEAVLADVYVPEGSTVAFDGQLPGVEAETGSFVVVLRQLVSNVLRTMKGEEGQIDLIIGWQGRIDGDDLALLVQVIDESESGAEPAPVGADVKGAKSDGIEMGLSLVRKIVAARGGDLTVIEHDEGASELRLVWPVRSIAVDENRFAMAQALDRLDDAMLRTAREIGAFAGEGSRTVAQRSGILPPEAPLAQFAGDGRKRRGK